MSKQFNDFVWFGLDDALPLASYDESIEKSALKHSYTNTMSDFMRAFCGSEKLNTQKNSFDLWQKYKNGNNNPISLEEIGVQDEIRQLIKTPNQLGKKNGHSLESDFIKQILDGKTSFKNSYQPRSVMSNVCHPLWAMGGITIMGDFDGDVTQNGEEYYLNGNINYEVIDKFTDPYDTFNLLKGEWNPDGKPYDIFGKWQEPVHQKIDKEQYEFFKKFQGQ